MRWNPDYPVSLLPEKIKKKFVETAGFLRDDLNNSYLEVILVPAPVRMHEGHKIRIVVNQNSKWYSDIYHSWGTDHFKRHRVIEALERIISQEDGRKIYRRMKEKL